MGRLRYTAIGSLDGYVADASGDFSWAAPDEEVHAHVNERERDVGTYLLGRRTYELMTVWETDPSLAAQSPLLADFAAVWQAADKLVHSTTLPPEGVVTARTRLERTFDVGAVARLKEAADADLGIAGPALALHAFRAGLVDDVELYLVPVVVGGGTTWWPAGVRLDLELVEEHRFSGGVVHLRYRAAGT